ncbi:MAG: hypothetical protein WC797_02520 [Candidatus Paceibacterota bacterium]|jgi:hypothetical protein
MLRRNGFLIPDDVGGPIVLACFLAALVSGVFTIAAVDVSGRCTCGLVCFVSLALLALLFSAKGHSEIKEIPEGTAVRVYKAIFCEEKDNNCCYVMLQRVGFIPEVYRCDKLPDRLGINGNSDGAWYVVTTKEGKTILEPTTATTMQQ